MRRSVLNERIRDAADFRLREHHDDDLAVHRRLKNQAAAFEFVAQRGGVGQVAVVRDGDLAARAIHRERLGVAEIGRAGGGITRVADGAVADEVVENLRIVENLRHEAHAVVFVKFPVVASDDAGAFLAAMLQRVKAEVSQFGGVRMAENAEDSAVMFGIMWFVIASRAPLNMNTETRIVQAGTGLTAGTRRRREIIRRQTLRLCG